MSGTLAIIGGYGLVGAQAARLLRERHPDLPIVLAGRRPEAARRLASALGATTVAMDVRAEQPLGALAERPAAVLAAVSDPGDRLVVDAMRRGVPIADINRGGQGSVLDVAVHASREQPRAPVLLSGSWVSGLTALAAAAVVRELGRADSIEISVLVSSSDRVGPDAWGFSKRLAWPYQVMDAGRRRTVQPLTGVRRVRCADGQERPGVRVGTLEQITLPLTLGVPTVETRLTPHAPLALWGLVALKRSGALRAFERPGLRRMRDALLHRSGGGDFAGFTVSGQRDGRTVSLAALDVRGQAHMNAVGAAIAAERVLGLTEAALPAGITFSEQSASPEADLASLREAGVIVHRSGFREPGPSRPPGAADRLHVLTPQTIEEDLTA